MLNRAACAISLGLIFSTPAQAEPATCAALTAVLTSIGGYSLTAPPAGDSEGWCVLDGARLRPDGDGPNISVETLRVKGEAVDGAPVSIEVDLTGLRISPSLSDRGMDDRLRALFRLQTADLRLSAQRKEAADMLELRDGKVMLSGGTEVTFSADLAGADLSAASLLTGALTQLDLTWKNDGRLLRPAMEAAGEGLVEGASGSAAVDAARGALDKLVDAMPAGVFVGDSQKELAALIPALPQGRGRLVLALTSEDGIGAARLAVAALSDDPLGTSAMARLFAGTQLTADWQPGLAP